MLHQYKTMCEHIPEFNLRPLTIEDFHNVCERKKVLTHFTKLKRNGHRICYHGNDVILIDSRLNNFETTFTAWHELSHYILHTPLPICLFGVTLWGSKQDFEADTLASIALFPESELEKIIGSPSKTLFERKVKHLRINFYNTFGK